jgi:hypothetical protein
MEYTIVGCITNYGVDDIKPFVESIEQSGYNGKKLMLVYDITSDTIEYLKSKGWDLYGSQLEQHIIVQRFRDMYVLLQSLQTDVIIWCDVKDIIFQKNPTEWLDKHMKGDILAFSESLIFNHDAWAHINAGTSFPIEWEWLKFEEIYCAGTIVGKKDAIKDLFIDIYRWSLTTSNPGQLADQAAYNILLRLHQFKDKVQFVKQQEGFAAQLHLKIKFDKQHLCSEDLATIENGNVTTTDGELFTIVHQYDRDLELKKLIQNKYK